MNYEQLLESITEEDIIKLMQELGSDYDRSGSDLKFKSICHCGNKRKLYYYHEGTDDYPGRIFHCYSECGTMSVLQLIKSVKNFETNREAYAFLCKFLNISPNVKKPTGFNIKKKVIKDWDFIEKYKKSTNKPFEFKYLPKVEENLLGIYDWLMPSSWENEYITEEALLKFGIMFSPNDWKAIIPHRDLYGNLIGIRGRSFLYKDEKERKYMPAFIENKLYNHPLHYNLYGLYENLETIKRTKKVFLVEAEKGVLQCESYYKNNNFTVGLCGGSMSLYQKKLLIHLGIKELILGLDRQYHLVRETEKEIDEYKKHIRKIEKIVQDLNNYMDVYVIHTEEEGVLEYKDSPTDKGKETLEYLLKNKIRM